MITIRFPSCCTGWIGDSQALILSSPNRLGTRRIATGGIDRLESVEIDGNCKIGIREWTHFRTPGLLCPTKMVVGYGGHTCVEGEIAELLHFSIVYSAILPRCDCGSPNGYSN